MEKADKAIALAVDNAARIESTARLLRSHINNSGVTLIKGATFTNKTRFGNVKAGGGVIVVFSGSAATLRISGTTIASGTSPLIAAIDRSGVLEFGEIRSGAVAMVIHSS